MTLNNAYQNENILPNDLIFSGSMVGLMSQFFGEPIQCDFKGVDGEVAKDYCWIHGSSYIDPEYQLLFKCIADLEGVERKEDAPNTSYYQWVSIVKSRFYFVSLLSIRNVNRTLFALKYVILYIGIRNMMKLLKF